MSILNYTPAHLTNSISSAEQLSLAVLTVLDHPMGDAELRACLRPLLLQLHSTLEDTCQCDLLLREFKGVRGLPLVSALSPSSC